VRRTEKLSVRRTCSHSLPLVPAAVAAGMIDAAQRRLLSERWIWQLRRSSVLPHPVVRFARTLTTRRGGVTKHALTTGVEAARLPWIAAGAVCAVAS